MVLLIALLLAAGPATVPPPKKIAVLDVKTGPKVDAALGPYLTQVLAAEVAARSGTSPLVSADIKALLGFEKTRRNFGCDEETGACIAEIAGALGVDEVVNVHLLTAEGPTGAAERFLLTSSRLDAHKASPLARDAQSIPFGDPAALELAVRRAAFRLYGGAEPAAERSKPEAASAPARPAAPAEATAAAPASAHRAVTWVAASGTVALAAGASVVGLSALSSANANDTSARNKAHLADGLWLGAALCAGLTVWLWLGDGDRRAAGAAPSALSF
jgi:hypothetical protein